MLEYEKSYIDMLLELQGAINSDETIPKAVKKKISRQSARLFELIFPYSA